MTTLKIQNIESAPEASKPLLEKSMVVNRNNGLMKADKSRTSSNVWIHNKQFKTNEIFRKTGLWI